MLVAHALRGEGFDASEDGTGRGTPQVPIAFSSKDHGADAAEGVAPTPRAMGHDGSHANAGGQLAVAKPHTAFGISNQPTPTFGENVCPSLDAKSTGGGRMEAVAFAQPENTAGGGHLSPSDYWAVRRLTPLECERLMGFEDGYTQVPYRGKAAADGPRYKALGNSIAINVLRIIGERIQMVDQMEDRHADVA